MRQTSLPRLLRFTFCVSVALTLAGGCRSVASMVSRTPDESRCYVASASELASRIQGVFQERRTGDHLLIGRAWWVRSESGGAQEARLKVERSPVTESLDAVLRARGTSNPEIVRVDLFIQKTVAGDPYVDAGDIWGRIESVFRRASCD